MARLEVMNLRQASRYLGVTPDTLYKYLGNDNIPAFKLGNRWRFKTDLLDRWMESRSERRAVRRGAGGSASIANGRLNSPPSPEIRKASSGRIRSA